MKQADLKAMLNNISDPNMRRLYGDIASGKFVFKVYCMNPCKGPDGKLLHKPGKLVGYIDNRGRCVEEMTKNKNGIDVAGAISSRDRFDGRKGFRCACGNCSIQCEEEKPVFSKRPAHLAPNKNELKQIYDNLRKAGKLGRAEILSSEEYDGFKVERI